MLAMTVLCVTAFIYIITTVDPETTNSAGFFLFYLALFLSLIGFTAIIGFIIRFIFLRHELQIDNVTIAFRQSFLFSGFIVALLYLLSRSLLTWLNAIILIIGLSALEFFLLRYGRAKFVIPAQAGIQESEE